MNIFILSLTIIFVLFIKFLNRPSEQEVFITCADCYRYIRISKELYGGSYSSIDWLRNFPEFIANDFPPPLISVLGEKIALMTGATVEYSTFYLPPILSILFMIPLYSYLMSFTNRYVALASCVMGATGFIYAERTTLGRFDTDSLILFFVFTIVYFLYRAVNTTSEARTVLYTSVATAVFHLFMWWYQKPLFSPFFIGGVILSLILSSRRKSNLTSHLLTLLIFISGTINYLFTIHIGSYLVRILPTSGEELSFPIHKYVNELTPVDLSGMIAGTVSNPVAFAISLIGLILLVRNHIRELAIALPIFAMGLLSLTGAGTRMLIYLTPFFGMGLGYALYILLSLLRKNLSGLGRRMPVYISIFGHVFTVAISVPPDTLFLKPRPVFHKEVIGTARYISKDFGQADVLSRPVVWTWWDYGYMLQYYGLPTFTDNGNWHIYKLFLLSQSLYTKDEQKTKRIIAFTTNNLIRRNGPGYSSLIKRALSYKGKPNREIIVFITQDMLRIEPIYIMGIYPDEPKGFGIVSAFNCQRMGKINSKYNCLVLDIDLSDLSISTSSNNLELLTRYKTIAFIDRETGKVRNIATAETNDNDRVLILVRKKEKLYLFDVHDNTFSSVLGRMFFNPKTLKEFEVMEDRFPFAVALKMK